MEDAESTLIRLKSRMKYYSAKDIQKAEDNAINQYENPSVLVITHEDELFVY